MLLFTLNLQTANAPAPSPAPSPTPSPAPSGSLGFEMVGRKRAKDYVRESVLASLPQAEPAKKAAKKQAEVIVVKAATALEQGESYKPLYRQWLKLDPIMPSNVDPQLVFRAMVERKLRDMEDEEILLLL